MSNSSNTDELSKQLDRYKHPEKYLPKLYDYAAKAKKMQEIVIEAHKAIEDLLIKAQIAGQLELASRLYIANGDGNIFVKFPEAEVGIDRYSKQLQQQLTKNGDSDERN